MSRLVTSSGACAPAARRGRITERIRASNRSATSAVRARSREREASWLSTIHCSSWGSSSAGQPSQAVWARTANTAPMAATASTSVPAGPTSAVSSSTRSLATSRSTGSKAAISSGPKKGAVAGGLAGCSTATWPLGAGRQAEAAGATAAGGAGGVVAVLLAGGLHRRCMAEDHPGPLRCAGQRTAGALLVRRRAGFEAGGVEDGGAHALHPRPVAAPPGTVPQRRSGREKAAQLRRSGAARPVVAHLGPALDDPRGAEVVVHGVLGPVAELQSGVGHRPAPVGVVGDGVVEPEGHLRLDRTSHHLGAVAGAEPHGVEDLLVRLAGVLGH